MKPVRPVREVVAPPRYPSVVEVASSRRGFFRGALGGVAALGGALLGGGRTGAAARRGWLQAEVPLSPPYRFGQCGDRQAEKVVLQTTSAALHGFLRDAREHPGLSAALRSVLGKHTCADLDDQRRLRRLEQALGRATAERYRERTGRRVSDPLATLVVGRRRRPILLGLLRTPSQPEPPKAG